MGHVNKFEDYVKDLKTFVDNVVKQTPHPKTFLLAHSMGGGIAARYIEEYPNDFTAAALSSPMLEPGNHLLFVNEGCKAVESTDWIRENIRGIKTPRYVLGKGDYEREDCGKSDLTHSKVRCEKTASLYEQFPDTKLGGPSTHWAAEACKASKHLRSKEETSKIRIPVLVLQAEKDTAVAPQGQREFCKNLNFSQHVKCEGDSPQIITGAYHELFVENDEYRIPALTKILDFFGKQ
jgi:lysophospholipase